ncbi:Hypothetical predicted protein, partial [Paramuricea clavata]
MASKNTLPVVNHDENIAPEEGHSPSPDVSKSRRKAPRSQVRKVVRTDLQSKVQEETNVTQPLLAVKSETTSNESFQEPECSERQVQNMVQDVINTTTTCKVLTSPRNENISIQTVRESGVRAINVTSETTVIEEDYQRKYFHLLNTMNDLQDKFLVSQRNFEDLVKAREAFIEELKGKLESNHREIGSIKQELETSNNKISELEEKRNLYEKKIQNLSVKVEDMKVMEAEVYDTITGVYVVKRARSEQMLISNSNVPASRVFCSTCILVGGGTEQVKCSNIRPLKRIPVSKLDKVKAAVDSYEATGQLMDPVTYSFTSLTATEQRYAQIEKECLAIVEAFKKFDQWLLGKANVTVHTDHQPLQCIFQKDHVSAPKRLQKMITPFCTSEILMSYLCISEENHMSKAFDKKYRELGLESRPCSEI